MSLHHLTAHELLDLFKSGKASPKEAYDAVLARVHAVDAKVKAYVFFKGRSILFKEQGEVLLLKFAQDVEEYGKAEQLPLLEGKKMLMIIAPKKTK